MPRKRKTSGGAGKQGSKRQKSTSPEPGTSLSRRPQRMAKSAAIVKLTEKSFNKVLKTATRKPAASTSKFTPAAVESPSSSRDHSPSTSAKLPVFSTTSVAVSNHTLHGVPVPERTRSPSSRPESSSSNRSYIPHPTTFSFAEDYFDEVQCPHPRETHIREVEKPLDWSYRATRTTSVELCVRSLGESPEKCLSTPPSDTSGDPLSTTADLFDSKVTKRLLKLLSSIPDGRFDTNTIIDSLIDKQKFAKLPIGLRGICEMSRMGFLNGITLYGDFYSVNIMRAASRAIYHDLWKETDKAEKEHFSYLLNMLHHDSTDFITMSNSNCLEKAISLIECSGGKGSNAVKVLEYQYRFACLACQEKPILSRDETIAKAATLEKKLINVNKKEDVEKHFNEFALDVSPSFVLAYRGHWLLAINGSKGPLQEGFLSNIMWY